MNALDDAKGPIQKGTCVPRVAKTASRVLRPGAPGAIGHRMH